MGQADRHTSERVMTPYLHPEDLTLFTEISVAMRMVAATYNLKIQSIGVTPNASFEKSALGTCSADGRILLTMRVGNERRDPASIWKTAAHELAHLRHFNHGVQFQEFELELLEAMQNKKQNHKDRVIDKIVKMQAVRDGEAKLGNVEAAEAFAAAINRMLVENELSGTDLDYARSTDDDPVIQIRADFKKFGIKEKQCRVAWEETLAGIVSRAHLCRFLLTTKSNQIWFVGTRSHASAAEYVYGMLVPLARNLSYAEFQKFKRENKGNPRAVDGFRASWLNAFTSRIEQRLAEQKADAVRVDTERRAARGEAEPSTGALLRLGGALARVDRYIDDQFKRRRAVAHLRDRGEYNATGAARGKAAADAMPIGRKGVGQGSAASAKMLGSGR